MSRDIYYPVVVATYSTQGIASIVPRLVEALHIAHVVSVSVTISYCSEYSSGSWMLVFFDICPGLSSLYGTWVPIEWINQ